MTVTTDGLETRLYEAGVRQRTQGGTPVRELLESLTLDQRRRAALWIHRNLCHGGADRADEWAVPWLSEQALGWTAVEADTLLRRLVGADALVDPGQLLRQFAALARLPLAAAQEAGDYDRRLLRAARQVSLSAGGRHDAGSENVAMRARLDALIGPEASDDTGLPLVLLDDEDEFGPRMRTEHATLLAGPGVAAFLEHCAAQGQVRATKRWRKQAAVLLAGMERGGETVRALLEGMGFQGEHRVAAPAWGGGSTWPGIASEGNTRLVRGLLWAAADIAEDWVVPAIAAVAINSGTGTGGSGGYCRNGKMATTAVAVLGDFGGTQAEQAVDLLGRLQRTIRNRTVLNGITAALRAVAERGGVTPSMLRERAVPSVGLDARGIREQALGDYTAVLSVTASGTPALSYRGSQGQVLKSAPKAVREEYGKQLTDIRAALKQLRTLMPVERARLEEHLMAGTRWAAADWERYYIDHPVTGTPARTLIWEASADEGERWVAGLPERTAGGWALAGAGGTAVPVTEGIVLRLWHPVRADAEEIRTWREELTGLELRQPFKQGFREVYSLTPAEKETRTCSNRFAGHILRLNQAKALLVERGWTGTQPGYFSDGRAADMVRELPRAGELTLGMGEFWRTRFSLRPVEQERDGGTASLCSTDQLRFERRRGARGPWEPTELATVPPLVLSEAMRDADLFVGVASIATDGQPRA
ncbi:uncharacterized protein DUF4132 [Streptomyces sp. SLBN-118]|uniref:DUF4132 domain-containing protein n=1 Tax=Streptomyces sp. SLBN-118 TaxID=2768454 RepID=UPI00114F7637|nr:DUF4132 domain-containing protein [Streptomyces sp. SLBN-118]TQK52334.1 uncharacterized protein DUF4132 [Streptomyces sp. SLBN-118]